jgi:hypothetical protein
MKAPEWLKAIFYLAVFFGGLFLLSRFGNASDERWKKADPEGYERYWEQARKEGIPDPRG